MNNKRFVIGLHMYAPNLDHNQIELEDVVYSSRSQPHGRVITRVPSKVDVIVFWDGDLILLWDNYAKSKELSNIARFDLNGNKIWQIEEDQEKTGYQAIYVNENENLIAVSNASFEYHVDPDTGKVTKGEFIK